MAGKFGIKKRKAEQYKIEPIEKVLKLAKEQGAKKTIITRKNILGDCWGWILTKNNNSLYVYKEKPIKHINSHSWSCQENDMRYFGNFNCFFSFIKWTDKDDDCDLYLINDLLWE